MIYSWQVELKLGEGPLHHNGMWYAQRESASGHVIQSSGGPFPTQEQAEAAVLLK